MGVAPGAGQQGAVRAGPSRGGTANGCHGLIRGLRDCFTSCEMRSAFTPADTVARLARDLCRKEEGRDGKGFQEPCVWLRAFYEGQR